MPLNSPITVLIIDNITADCSAMVEAMGMFPNVRIAGRIATLDDTFSKTAALKPDLIVISYELPGFDLDNGLTRLKRLSPDTEIVLVSEEHRTTSESSLKALELGAMYFIKKPKESAPESRAQYYNKYFRPVINLYTVSRNTREVRNTAAKNKVNRPVKADNRPQVTVRSAIRSDFTLLAAGSSLGGPEALKRFIPKLPPDFPLPVVITQHMPEGFTATMAGVLDEMSTLIVREARGGEILRPGYVYIAPGGKHLLVKRNRSISGGYILVLDDGPMVHGCRPSVDVMFNSIADSIAGNVMAVVLTGMGSDGCDGVRAMKANGKCYCITQNEATSVVYGMPGAVSKAGLSDMSLALDNIASKVNDLARSKSSAPMKSAT